MKEKVIVTGASGFLGSHLVPLLLAGGYEVIGIKRREANLNKLGDLANDGRITWFSYEDNLDQVFLKPVKCIIHLATCYGRGNDTFSNVIFTNLQMPTKLLEYGIANGVEAFINADTFFHEQIGIGLKERSYVTTKKMFIAIAKDVVAESGVKFVNLKIEQMYGPKDNDKKFFTNITRELISNKISFDLTKGEQKRDFVYVEDVAAAFLQALNNMKSLQKIEEFNIGTGESVSIKEVVEYMKKLVSSSTSLNWGALPYRDFEIMDSIADLRNNSKISWQAKFSWKEGFQKTIESFQR